MHPLGRWKLLFLFLFGLVFAPVAILLHEGGHFVALAILRCKLGIHFGYTTYGLSLSPRSLIIVTAAGPTVSALLAAGGLFWLWRLRRHRLQHSASATEWLITIFSLCALRWLRCSTGAIWLQRQTDEAKLSANLGFPEWFLPLFLAPIALAALISTVRLHPSGNRLAPFGSAILGILIGAGLWLKILGPRLLP